MVSVRRRALIAAALGVTMLAAPVALWAARGVVVRKDGRINAGEIVADDDAGITLQIADIDLFIPRQDIASVKYQKTVAEQYLQRRAKLADDDLDSRYELAKWLLENEAFDLALKEVDQLLQRFVTDSRLEILKRTSLAQRDLVRRRDTVKQKPPFPKKLGGARLSITQSRNARLTTEQINLIKVWETDPMGRPRVAVPPKVIDELFKRYAYREEVPKGARQRREFRGQPGYEQMQLLLMLDARDLLAEIEVKDEPVALRTFRQSIHRPYVLNYCGSKSCHGSDQMEGLRLVRMRSRRDRDRTAYTNFYILHAYESKAKTGHLIDRQYPEMSLMPQYGLPKADASTPHPETDKWRPYYRNLEDSRYLTSLDWIGSLSRTLRVKNYGFSYKFPPPDKKSSPDQPGTTSDRSGPDAAGKTES